ncbi:phage GP46 family protein [Escherichia coli]
MARELRKRTCASAPLDPLTRAVVISLFTWRRAEPDDNADVPMGWWGDTWPAVQNDRYGSRLWLLQRSKLTNQLVQTVRGYIRECLQWMIDDGVVSRIDLDTGAIMGRVALNIENHSCLSVSFKH